MGSHQSSVMGKDEWLTPPYIIERLGRFDLDPCAPINPPWIMADKHYSILDDGLEQSWFGRVWCNPPYGNSTWKWLKRCSEHRNAIALIFARTETDMFFRYVWEKADALFFFRGRLFFHHVDGSRANANSGAPSVLIAYGQNNVQSLKRCNMEGKFMINYKGETDENMAMQ